MDLFAESLTPHSEGYFTASTWNFLLFSNDRCVTPWHIDFSGTSVFYVVLRGEKIFGLLSQQKRISTCSRNTACMTTPVSKYMAMKTLCIQGPGGIVG